MKRYISLVLTSYTPEPITQLEPLLSQAGLRPDYSDFKPAIPGLRASWTLVVRTNRIEVEHVRGLVKSALTAIPGGDQIDLTEMEVQHTVPR